MCSAFRRQELRTVQPHAARVTNGFWRSVVRCEGHGCACPAVSAGRSLVLPCFAPNVQVVQLCQGRSAADLTAVCSVGPRGAQVQFRGAAELGGDWGSGVPRSGARSARPAAMRHRVSVRVLPQQRCLWPWSRSVGGRGPALLWLVTALGRELNLLKMNV